MTIIIAWHSVILFALLFIVAIKIGQHLYSDDEFTAVIAIPFWTFIGLLLLLIYGGIFWW